MATKAYRRFVQRTEDYNSDLELCDLLAKKFFATQNSQATVAEALGSSNMAHPHLGRRQNSRQSRKIVGYHLKATLYAAFIKDLFEDFSAFLAETLTKAAMKGIDPARFIGNVKLEIHAADILGAGSWDAVVRMISDALFRRLENERNTKDLVEKASVRIGLQLDTLTLVRRCLFSTPVICWSIVTVRRTKNTKVTTQMLSSGTTRLSLTSNLCLVLKAPLWHWLSTLTNVSSAIT